jgi:hypothetical protein
MNKEAKNQRKIGEIQMVSGGATAAQNKKILT